MVKEGPTDRQERLEKFRQHLEEARKFQEDLLKYGLEAVHLYVEDVDGDWLERWGEDEEELVSEAPDAQAVAVGQTLVGGAIVEAVTAFLESDDPVAVQVRERLGERSLPDVAAELENCLSIPEEDDQILAVKNALAGSLRSGGTNRDSSDENDEIELLDLAESLLEKLAQIKLN
jgi:hypothetical protein